MKRGRALEKKAKTEKSAMNAALGKVQFATVKIARCQSDFDVARGACCDNAAWVDYLRDQVRALHAAHDVSKKQGLPAIGKGRSDAEIHRLEIALTGLFEVPLRSNVVERMVEDATPYPVRPNLPAPHELARTLRAKYEDKVRVARIELQDLLSKGKFCLFCRW